MRERLSFSFKRYARQLAGFAGFSRVFRHAGEVKQVILFFFVENSRVGVK